MCRWKCPRLLGCDLGLSLQKKNTNMIRTAFTPNTRQVSFNIPQEYVGKEVEILLYMKEELLEDIPEKINDAARFKGLLTEDEAVKYHAYIKKAKDEWERDI